jgi:hypothetical protein
MISNRDISQAAALLVELYRDDALTEAARMIDLMEARCDREGRLLWFRIKRVIEWLQALPTGPTQRGGQPKSATKPRVSR